MGLYIKKIPSKLISDLNKYVQREKVYSTNSKLMTR